MSPLQAQALRSVVQKATKATATANKMNKMCAAGEMVKEDSADSKDVHLKEDGAQSKDAHLKEDGADSKDSHPAGSPKVSTKLAPKVSPKLIYQAQA